MTNTIVMHLGDVRDVLDRLIADGATADLAVTSPPFLALRSYLPADHPDKHREIGSEATPAAFLDTSFGWTAQLGALLPEWASIAVEIGDTMSGSGGAGGDYNADGLRAGQPAFKGSASRSGWHRLGARADQPDQPPNYRKDGTSTESGSPGGGPGWPLAKSMCLIPHSYTFGLIYGHNPITGQPSPAGRWRVRNVIAWARPNPPVGSLGKRNPVARTGDYKFRPATSYITVACRGTGRFFDLDAVRTESSGQTRGYVGDKNAQLIASSNGHNNFTKPLGAYTAEMSAAGAPPLDWHTDNLDGDWLWKLATAPYKGSHYATYPLTLPRRLIAAMCPARVCTVCGWPSERITGPTQYVDVPDRPLRDDEARRYGSIDGKRHNDHRATARDTTGWTDCGCSTDGTHWRPGITLDCFGGSGTTAVAAALEHRDAVLIDIDERNIDLVRRRLTETCRIVTELVRVRQTGTRVTYGRHRRGVPTPIRVIWTVDQAAPAQGEQVTGQTNLLDLFGVLT